MHQRSDTIVTDGNTSCFVGVVVGKQLRRIVVIQQKRQKDCRTDRHFSDEPYSSMILNAGSCGVRGNFL